MNVRQLTNALTKLLLTLLLMTSCNVARYVPEGDLLLNETRVVCDNKNIQTTNLSGYIRQYPNSKWFSVFKVPLLPYSISGVDFTKRINRFMHKLGEAPVIYDSLLAYRSSYDMERAVQNLGYLHASVNLEKHVKKHKLKLVYRITPGQLYSVSSITKEIQDDSICNIIEQDAKHSFLSEQMPFDINILDAERARINNLLRNNGYYLFNKDYIRYEVDTLAGKDDVAINMIIENQRDNQRHRTYSIGNVSFITDTVAGTRLRNKVLRQKTEIFNGDKYREANVQKTYSKLSQLGAILGTNISFAPSERDTSALDARIGVALNKPHGFNVELEGTNSAGDLGAAVAASYQNRNLFHGSELLSFKLRGAFEAIKGLEGYDDQNYIEYSAEVSLAFPDFMFPFLKESFRRSAIAKSELSFMYDSQDRPEFHRRVVTGAWRYRWSRYNRMRQHRIDLLDLNYVFMPWISNTFRRDYLDDPSSRNAILRYNYENLFIMKWGYNFHFNSQVHQNATGNYGTNAYSIRFNVESAGNLLYGITSALNSQCNAENQYTLFNIAYAQYVKGDFDFAKSFRLDNNNSFAMHFGLGIAYPYGNSKILPYEKRYFSGGANSVRGWSVRELGPGSFKGHDGRIDFINQTGDIKLDMNVEYRTHLFWKFDGAAFVDAGNIWTIRNYEEQPGGQFGITTFWRQIAVAYGLGLRLNFNFFILRLDAGMKAINPAYSDAKRHYPIIHPRFSRDCSVHFAVGLPF